MHKLYELKETLIEEMEEFAGKSNLSKDDVMFIKYLSSSVDHICNIIDACEEEEGYSGRGYSMRRYSRMDDLINDAPNDRIRQKMQSIMSEM